MPFVSPGGYSKGELDRAGERIRSGDGSLNDIAMLDNWRASHLYVINTFQSSLRARRKRSREEEEITIAQRLKRRPTIIDKLTREPGMSLSRMHDIAGCRLIFPDVDQLYYFRDGVLKSKAAHELVGGEDRYNYIVNPKESGYRGIHDVYKYNAGSMTGKTWNGLRIEVQYRTIVQHGWATDVEISDIVNSTRLKFSEAGKDISRLFLLASEILSRSQEGTTGFCQTLETADVLAEFDHLENSTHAVGRLRNLTSTNFSRFARSSKLFILINFVAGTREGEFEAEGFADNRSAAERYSQLEAQLQGEADVVLVGASEQDAIKLAYTNYFSDASIFIRFLDQGREALMAG